MLIGTGFVGLLEGVKAFGIQPVTWNKGWRVLPFPTLIGVEP